MDPRMQRELRLLRLHALITTPCLLVLGLSAFSQAGQRARFEEIDVERINIVEPDGALRMVLSNRPRSPGPIAKGKPFGYAGGTRPGMIFYNDEGTEQGGLLVTGKREPDGTFAATGHFAFDQYDQDQVVYLQYLDNNGQRFMGLTVGDRANVPITEWVAARDSISRMPDGPEKTAALEQLRAPRNGVPLFARRLFVGRDRQRSAMVDLADPMGRTRLRLVVDSLGGAAIEFLDENGTVTRRLPE